MKRKILATMGLVPFLFTLFAVAGAPKLRPQMYQPEIAQLVSAYLSYYHYSKTQINDNVSRRLLEEYIAALDPSKLFFTASDIADFQQYRHRLDDDLMATPVQLDAPFNIYNRYRERVFERVDVILALLDRKFDYDKDEYYAYNREDAPWARTKEDLNDLWRRRLKEEMVRFKLRDKPEDEAIELLKKRYKRVRKNVSEEESPDVLERFLSSLAETFDPHSAYLKPETKDNFDIQMGHSLEGIGATLTRDGEYTKVVEIVKGGPAYRSGQVHPNDKIIAVGQGNKEAEDVVDLRLDKVVKKIRGKKGTKVRLTIIPANSKDQSETKEVVIIRDRVEITSADAKAEINVIKDENGNPFRIGIIEIPSFYMDTAAKYRGDPKYKSTTRDVRKLIDDLEKKNVDGLVIDLRQNGGGSLDEAIQLTGLFIESGPVVQIKDHRGRVQVEKDPDPAQVFDGPLLVLTSVFSASASEIFSSAIQDYGRGLVVGSQATHGKGTVQNVFGLDRTLARHLKKRFDEDIAGALKVTTHKFYRVSGGSTQFKGVRPDIVLPSPFDGMKVTEEALDYALPWDEIDPVKFNNYNQVRDSLAFLKTNSAKRIANNAEFRYVLEDIAYREKLEQENRASLRFAKRLKEKESLEAKEENRDEERKLRDFKFEVIPVSETEEPETEQEEDKDEVVVPDFILHEALMVLRDYISFHGHRVAEAAKPGGKESL